MRCTLLYKNDKMYVEDTTTGKQYPVKTFRRSTRTRYHVTFVIWPYKWWGMTDEAGNFTARQYKNWYAVVGGSGHHNVTYIRNKNKRNQARISEIIKRRNNATR